MTEAATDELWIHAGFTYSQQIAEEVNKSKTARTFEEIVPKAYWEFSKVFSEQESDRLPCRGQGSHELGVRS